MKVRVKDTGKVIDTISTTVQTDPVWDGPNYPPYVTFYFDPEANIAYSSSQVEVVDTD